MNEKPSVAVVILAYNESLHLPRALDHVRSFAKEIFVIDSFSTDDTVSLARLAAPMCSSMRSRTTRVSLSGLSQMRRSQRIG